MTETNQDQDSSMTAKELAGCAAGNWNLLVNLPMWLILLFGILQTIDAPTWTWILYFIYLPCNVLGKVLNELFKMMNTK
jgi:hypothetical protein